MEHMKYAHYFPLTSQGSVYSITKIPVVNGVNKLLVASLKRETICFEYAENSLVLSPISKEILFTYIPNGAEIISIDAFNKSHSSNDFVIGIGIIKTDTAKEAYLNIYTGEDSNEFNIDSISQNCLIIDLHYIPYQLRHAFIPNFKDENTKEIVLLLSGSDCVMHIYGESTENHIYQELNIEQSFVEFMNLSSIVTCFDIAYFDSMKRRITAYGCESGYIKVSVVNTEKNVIISSFDIQFVNMISCMKLFLRKTNNDVLSTGNLEEETPEISLLIVNTTLPSVVFSDILPNGFRKRNILPKSNFFNVQSTTCVADIDLDGENELLIGTYGQELLIYKYEEKLGWKLSDQQNFGNPIYSIQHFDITGDGVRELIVLTLKGVHILQHKPEEIEKKLLNKFR